MIYLSIHFRFMHIFKVKFYFLLQYFGNRSIMIRARSAMIRKNGTIETEMEHQVQKNKMLDDDRRLFLRQAEQIKEKYNEQIEKLKNENKKLKNIRDQFIASKKNKCVLSRTAFNTSGKITFSTNDQNFLRINLDKQKHETKAKKNLLFTLQDKLKQVEENKLGFMQQNPMMKTIRLLENRLDKVMIKFNQAQSIQQTYEEVVKRLKEERVGYDSQLASIETCLKGKEHDFQQLLLLAHDATHAKEGAFAELKRFQQRRMTVQEMRTKYICEKKQEINKDAPHGTQIVSKGQRSTYNTKQTTLFGVSYKHDQNYQRQQLNDYQEAFRKLKEVTGVIDANQIIQKYKTQGLTTNSLQELQSSYSKRIEQLKLQKEYLKKQLQNNKFLRDKDLPQRRRLDQIEQDYARISNEYQRSNIKYQKLNSSLIQITAGIQHLKELTSFYKIDNQIQAKSDEDQLKNIDNKIRKIYDIIKSDSNYMRHAYKANASAIQAILKEQYKTTNDLPNKIEASQDEEDLE